MPEDKDKNPEKPEKMDYTEFIKDFLDEGEELLERLNRDAVKLEKDPSNIKLVHDMFRAVHTLKATAGFLELTESKNLLQALENVLVALREKKLKVTDKIMEAIYGTLDAMRALLDGLAKKGKKRIDVAGQLRKLEEIAVTEAGKEPEVRKEEVEEKISAAEEAAEVSIATMRVPSERLDALMNLVGELVTSRNRLDSIRKIVRSDELDMTYESINSITSELQSEMLNLRLIPISHIFNKFPRLVRDLARQMKKDVNLIIEGQETGLDKTIIEDINDPLIHLVRNAISHGIEGPEERKKKDKAPTGRLKLAAKQEQNYVVITVEDDGAGIDAKLIKEEACSRKIITEEEAREMTDKDAINLIFTPGFSVVKKAGEIAGRGVGMDVVKSNIEKLNGIIDIETELGKGSRFILKVPLTLAILAVLQVKISNQIYAFPLGSVEETVRVPTESIKTAQGREIISLRGEPLPIVRLDRVFGLTKVENREQSTEHREQKPEKSESAEKISAESAESAKQSAESAVAKEVRRETTLIVLRSVEERVGVIVDAFAGKEETVIKPLGGYLGEVEGVAGTTILGSGEVILILDVPSLFKMVKREVAGV